MNLTGKFGDDRASIAAAAAHHGRPADGIHAIQIELRRDLYMNETTYELVEPGFTQLSSALAELLAKLRTFRP